MKKEVGPKVRKEKDEFTETLQNRRIGGGGFQIKPSKRVLDYTK